MSSPKLDQTPYTIDTLPYGVISTSTEPSPRCAVAIGEHAIDLAKYAKTGAFSSLETGQDLTFEQIFSQPALNTFAALPWPTRRTIRSQIQESLKANKLPSSTLTPLKDVRPHLPMSIPGFSDFYTSLDHCKNCSGELTTANIPSNWFITPSVYNSRVSSLLPTPSTIPRPVNVSFTAGLDSAPVYGPSKKLDFELEMGYFVSRPIPYGSTLPIADAKQHIFGFVLLNDWSARDHQMFEMRPLGPFHSKGFGTSISNWIVPMEALEPFATAPTLVQDPKPFAHLTWPASERDAGALDVKLRVRLVRDGNETTLSTSNLKYMYWTPYQQLTHHAASGCGMAVGDLIGTGTISGSGRDGEGRMNELGCMYEAERTKTDVMPQGAGEYLADGDEVVLEGWCERDGRVVVGFGECRGRVGPARG
ncbi:hypothetical protein M409DRAFT_63471 [Zasmidium cellare ATCC 36951]|uniref:Fumarylacetoacetase n=1 Tax=Zasmidium cellare ATCC 36951 TaxID=1080233 RepID=A0A6A6D2R6_ZASCE|nr:uncharacterized protein M409DRAFT_63471 [Zasmidium cellare ATCC 36951]KAF2171936.1 hypothetical protein M409DRAFT_63471 [Zasmidium cellare ATCC 36951]